MSLDASEAKSMDQAMVRAIVARDCAQALRIRYLLPETLTAKMTSLFPAATVELREFSKFVKGAKDQLYFYEDLWRASGVLGSQELLVTFGKLGRVDDGHLRERFEQCLTDYGWLVVYES